MVFVLLPREAFDNYPAWELAMAEANVPAGFAVVGYYHQGPFGVGQPFCLECLACGSPDGVPVRGLVSTQDDCAEDGDSVFRIVPLEDQD